LRLLLLLPIKLSWLVLVLVSSTIILWSIVWVALSRRPHHRWLFIRNIILYRFLKFVPLGLLLFCCWLLSSNLVRYFLLLVAIYLLLIGTSFTVVLATKYIKLLVSTRSIRNFYRGFLIWHIVVLWLLLLVWIVVWLLRLAVVLTAILLLCWRLHLSTATLSWNFIVSPPKTKWTLATYQIKLLKSLPGWWWTLTLVFEPSEY
jgi:hypothetical protein